MFTFLKATAVFCGIVIPLWLLAQGYPNANRTFKYESHMPCVSGYTTSTQNGWTLEAWQHGGSRSRGGSCVEMTLRLTSAERNPEAPAVKSARLEIRPENKPEEASDCAVASSFVLEQRKSLQVLLLLDVQNSKEIRLKPNPGWVVEVKGVDKEYWSIFSKKPGKYLLKATVILDNGTKLVVDDIVIVFQPGVLG